MYINRLTSSADLFGPHPPAAPPPVPLTPGTPSAPLTAEEAIALYRNQLVPGIRRMADGLITAMIEARTTGVLSARLTAVLREHGHDVGDVDGFALMAAALAGVLRTVVAAGYVAPNDPRLAALDL